MCFSNTLPLRRLALVVASAAAVATLAAHPVLLPASLAAPEVTLSADH
jgi:hypothetical protein